MIQKVATSITNTTSVQPLALARLALLLYTILIIFASLTPFTFKLASISAFAWMGASLPKFIPIFDVWVNILGYLLFGFLAVFAVYPRVLKWSALILVLSCGVLLSGTLESLQTFLPGRISNLTDWYANTLGTLIGALFALPLRPNWLSGNRAERYRFTYFGPHQGFFLMLILFPFAQIFPINVWLGMGDLDQAELRVSQFWSTTLNNASQELLITSLALTSISAFFLYGTRSQTSQLKLIALLMSVSVAVKIAMSQLQYGAYGLQYWASFATGAGLLIGLVAASLMQRLQKRTQWLIAFIGLNLLLILVNILPHNPYHLSQLELLPQGRLMHFNGLLEWLSLVWPFLAIGLLIKDFKMHWDSEDAGLNHKKS